LKEPLLAKKAIYTISEKIISTLLVGCFFIEGRSFLQNNVLVFIDSQ